MSEPQGGKSCASQECCINPKVGKHLEKFNTIPLHRLGDNRLVKSEQFHEMIDHIFVCRYCRKHLSESGKEIFSSEMFWGGYFVEGQVKNRRIKLRTLVRKSFSSHPKEIINLVIKTSRQAGIKEERKRIERFIED